MPALFSYQSAKIVCSWLDRRISGNEPDRIVVLNPLIAEDDFTISWTRGEVAGISAKLPYINALQREDKLQIFDVYNDLQGNFVVTRIDPRANNVPDQVMAVLPDLLDHPVLLPDSIVVSASKVLFDDDPRNNIRGANHYFCSGFESECGFGNCAVNRRLVWGPYCREEDYPYIQPGQYRVSVYGEGKVRLGATDYGSSSQMFSLGRYDMELPASFSFCWQGREANGYGFETIVVAQSQDAHVDRIKVEYLGSDCTQ